MPLATPTRLTTWLLCLLLAWLSFSPPPCEFCDGPHAPAITQSFHPTLHHPAPTPSDACNGICACCGFHWIPAPCALLTLPHQAAATSAPETPSPIAAPRTTPFRPPRATLLA